MVLAYFGVKPTALISAKVKPLPALTFLLYLTVGALTTGLKESIGLGAILAAFLNLACLLEAFTSLVKVNSDSFLPVLSEVVVQ